jgi:diguanylate cyclase (GGDEF)-like protein
VSFVAGSDNSAMQDDVPVSFHAEPEAPACEAGAEARPWRILIADDDEEVHFATAYALRKVLIDGRPLELLHARSAAEAIALLRKESNVAVAMLDVVMETPDAGLRLVEAVRQELGLDLLRIVLRTGQPGYAPELEIIRRYDINDYRTKSELSQIRLITTLTAAVRAYEQLDTERTANRAIDAMARSSSTLFQVHDSRAFANAALSRLEDLLAVPVDALACMEGSASMPMAPGLHVLASRGRFSCQNDYEIERIGDIQLLRSVRRCMAARTCVFEAGRFSLWIGNGSRDAVIVVDHPEPLHAVQKRLIEMFAATLGVGFENVDLIERLDFFAFHDPLTRLPNRTRFISAVDQSLFARQSACYRLILADILRFSEVNDALGHRCGDSLLVAVARRLRSAFGSQVLLARISGDTFAFYGPENELDPAAISRACEAPFFIHGHSVTVRVHLGQVKVSGCTGNAVELLRSACLALNAARQAGAGCVRTFDSGMADDVQRRVAMLHNLRASIDFRRGLSLNYQPLINVRDGRVQAVEVLVRWRNDAGESIAPGVFIPLAERTGMIHELGYWVMEQAIERLAVWQRQGWPDLALVINVSAAQLQSRDLVSRIAELLEFSDVAPGCITLDLNDQIIHEPSDALHEQLGALRRLGIKLALDDFCNVFVSLDRFTEFPIDVLKIARNYVAQLGESDAERAVVHSLTQLARMRGLGVVAKGVERAEQVELLLAMDCDCMQGFYLARPMLAEQFEIWLRGQNPGPSA